MTELPMTEAVTAPKEKGSPKPAKESAGVVQHDVQRGERQLVHRHVTSTSALPPPPRHVLCGGL